MLEPGDHPGVEGAWGRPAPGLPIKPVTANFFFISALSEHRLDQPGPSDAFARGPAHKATEPPNRCSHPLARLQRAAFAMRCACNQWTIDCAARGRIRA